MPRGSRTPYVVLGLLGLSGRRPRSGYEIKKAIDTVIANFWHESDGQLYPALRELEVAGDIAVKQQTTRGRHKTLYAITPQGRKRLRQWLARPVEVSRPREELILKLAFGSEAETADLIRHVEDHRRRAEHGLAQCRRWLQEGAKHPSRYRPYVQLTVKAGIRMAEASLRWADETLEALRAMKSASSPP
ncbi:MAG TPA: PadR family transcriptional regulator [Opitutaceae bacterium]|nr:PadR family transcriptional regulator [Opitutaceae bacterium]